MSRSEPLKPKILNQTLTLANTEYAVTLPKGTKGYSIQARQSAAMRLAYVTGIVGTGVAIGTDGYITVKSDSSYTPPDKMGWSWTISGDTAPVLYLASGTAGTVAEIAIWLDVAER